MDGQLSSRKAKLQLHAGKLDALSPLNILGRGYAITQRQSDMKVIHAFDQVDVGDTLRVRLAVGALGCRVESQTPPEPASRDPK